MQRNDDSVKESVPLYKQLKAQLLEDIRQGRFSPGELLPSEAELAQTYGVSRTTVRQAVGDLVSGGFVIRRQGKGTYVAEHLHTSTATTLYGFAEVLRSSGLNVVVKVERAEERPCPDSLTDILSVPVGRRTLFIERTAWVDGICYFHDESYVLPPYHVDLSQLAKRPEVFDYVYGFFEQNGVRINSGHQSISAQLASERDRHLFGLSDPAAVLVIERTTYDETGAAVEFSEVRYAADRYQFTVNLLRQVES
ncbi:GntR family transcriptional regulator [Alicyclobacillus dauci]|uniref:GntR family transcriptional regulator n=1 Tax=Alicyclobacillus dauci TaxID=1475485 RepID=A0ABY6Z9J4_9BACL|nr:GntR family transcriptional regulator [Alicyclobacillus dauci]WAH38931.1 GntR family transcriptional regulator [Alicyclobacillus dauci]